MTTITSVLTAADQAAITTARGLVLDAVEQAGSGHPGTALALTPAAHLLFQRHLRHDPSDPLWEGRDRFVLSCGHASILLYTQLYLTGYDVDLDDLRGFRRLGSRTPGHPELGHTAGVETTTGPLGQGLATAVGMAMAFAHQRALYDPDPPAAESMFDRNIWVLCSDGDLQEGISYEAAALAGRHRLGHLCVIFDDNRIQIEGSTELSTDEDVEGRFTAQRWHVQQVGLGPSGDLDVDALDAAMAAARAEVDRPSLVVLRSTIAWPAPHARDTAAAHGSPLGPEETTATKRELGLDPGDAFAVPQRVLAHARRAVDRGRELRRRWLADLERWTAEHPDAAAAWRAAGTVPDDLVVPAFEAGEIVATRDASSRCIQVLAEQLPQLWGGSADLGDSNKTTIESAASFLPESPTGRVVHWGVREHAMAAALNGIALAGHSLPFAGTFLVFSDYTRPAIRLASLMGLPVTYVWTHDSIALGADGPTHQPVEHLASLRAMPGLEVFRPADARETAATWRIVVEDRDHPIGLVLARQGVPVLDVDAATVEDGVRRGGYVVHEAPSPEVVVVATGSEVSLAVEAARASARPVRVISLPCRERFLRLPDTERNALIPSSLERVVVEAATSFGWSDVVGPGARLVTMDEFGASGAADEVQAHFGFTVANVQAAIEG